MKKGRSDQSTKGREGREEGIIRLVKTYRIMQRLFCEGSALQDIKKGKQKGTEKKHKKGKVRGKVRGIRQ